MKTRFLQYLLLFLFLHVTCQAKKVKIAVDMQNEPVASGGVHVMGNFQALLGEASDWLPAATPLLQENTTSIYSIIVDLPAHQTYEYRYVNGNQNTDAESVPDASKRTPAVANRWFYVDSLQDDTTNIAAVLYAGNAPKDKKLFRPQVDMTYQMPVSANGVHIVGLFQGNNPGTSILVNNRLNLYENLFYIDSGTVVDFAFVNGNSTQNIENVPTDCSFTTVNNRRTITITQDVYAPMGGVCYGWCYGCSAINVKELEKNGNAIDILPNPAHDYLTIRFKQKDNYGLSIVDCLGRVVFIADVQGLDSYTIHNLDIPSGVYTLLCKINKEVLISKKIIIN